MIEDNFFPVSPDLPGTTFTARTEPYIRRITVLDRNAMGPDSLTPNPDALTNTINIACKGEGWPKSTIVWVARDSDDVLVPINESNIFVPRQGRSILTVNIDPVPGNTRTITYACTATNEEGEVNGEVTIERQCETAYNYIYHLVTECT